MKFKNCSDQYVYVCRKVARVDLAPKLLNTVGQNESDSCTNEIEKVDR